MNKYELALVVSANVEDEVRTATIEKVNELITRFGGTITDPGTCEKKKLAYEIQHMSEGFYNFIKFSHCFSILNINQFYISYLHFILFIISVFKDLRKKK